MTTLSDIDVTDTLKELATTPAWLIQYLPYNARALQTGWDAGDDFEYPAVNRHLDAIAENDLVYFWVSGPGPNEVTPAQSAVILRRLEEVMGR